MGVDNKKRNTAFIYETLVREIVKQSVAKNEEKKFASNYERSVAPEHI